MAEIVDSIVAELIARDNGYIATFDRAITKHKEFTSSVPKIDGIEVLSKGAKRYADQHAQSLGKVVKDEEQASQRITATRKKRVAEAKASDEAEVASAKRSAKEKADAEIAEQRRAQAALRRYYAQGPKIFEAKAKEISARNAVADAAKKEAAEEVAAAARVVAAEEAKAARLRAVAERAVAARTVTAGSGRIPNSDLSRGGAPLFIPPSALGGSQAELAATEEIDRVTRDIAINKARLVGLEGQEREELQREIRYLETYNRLKKVGVAETEAQVLAEKELVAAEGRRGLFRRSANVSGLGQANQFALGATGGRFGYSFSGGAIAGIAGAAALYAGVSAVSSGIDYGKQLAETAEQIGLTTKQLQIYQTAAIKAGATTQQFASAFGQLNNYLGRAQEGDKQAVKTFDALGISIKDAGSAGDILPTLIERISSISDPAKRAAVETRLFGEEGRRLDSLLGGGIDKVNALADSMEKAGTALSAQDISDLKEASVALAELKRELQVDLSRVVASNKDAILGLAQSFVTLADKAFAAIQRLQQFGAHQVLEGVVSNFAGQDDKNAAKAFLLRTHTGRVQLYGEAERRESDIRSGNGSFDVRPGAPSIAQQRKAALDRIAAQKREIAQAEAASRSPQAPGIQSGNVNTGALGGLFAPNGAKGKSAARIAREAEQRTKRFQDSLSRFQEEELRAQEALTGDINQRADIESDIAKRAYERQVSDIESERVQNVLRGADKELEQRRADQLKAAAQAAYQQEAAVIEQHRSVALARSANDHAQRELGFQAQHLNNELALATTSAQRRKIELRLLDNARDQERNRLQGVINTNLPGSPEALDAADQLKTLQQRTDDRRAGIIRETETSMDAYKRSLEVTADTISDFGVHALQDFNSELDHSITKALHLHGVFGEIIGDLIDMAVKQAMFGALGDSGGGLGGFGGFLGGVGKLLGIGGGSGFGSTIASNDSFIDSAIASIGVGFAGGGSGIIGGRPGIDQNLLSINGSPVAKVGRGELLSVSPNVALSNQRVNAPATQQSIVVVQPIHADFSGARTDEQTMRQFAAYADARSRQAYQAAVQTAGSQVSGIVKRKQSLGS